MITQAWQVDEEATIERLIALRNQLVDATEDEAVLFHPTANRDLKTLLEAVEYIIGNDDDNPWQVGWMATLHPDEAEVAA